MPHVRRRSVQIHPGVEFIWCWSACPRDTNHAVLNRARHGSGYLSSSDLGLPLWVGLRRCLPMCRPVRGLAPVSYGTVDPYTAPRGIPGAHSFQGGPGDARENFASTILGFCLRGQGFTVSQPCFPAFYWVSPLGPRGRSRNFKISRRPRPHPPAGTKNARRFSNYGE